MLLAYIKCFTGIIGMRKGNFMAQQLYRIVLDCIGLPNEVATERTIYIR